MSNGDDLTRRLSELLRTPTETLDVELKNWLDIRQNAEHRATLAKELIAIANHGGGYVILGFAETSDGIVPAEPRPQDLSGYSSDAVNSVVVRYAEPAFHCDVHIVQSPHNDLQYPVISVPGGHHVPIRSKRSGPDGQNLQQDRYYVRRPGPSSEAPQSGQEWDALIRRCVANAREELVDRFRLIMEGGPSLVASETDLDRLSQWFEESLQRWRDIVEPLPVDHGARMAQGHYAIAYQILGDFNPPSGSALLEAMRSAEVQYTGWPPFWVNIGPAHRPYPYENHIECWFADADNPADPDTSDFWRASPTAQFFLVRGYQEDAASSRQIEPGTLFDVALPVWRIGEVLLHAASMSRVLAGENGRVVLVVEWSGLRGRKVASFGRPPRRLIRGNYICRDDAHRTSLEVNGTEIEAGLPEILDRLVRPLYERFDFFSLPAALTAEETADLLGRRR